MIRIDEPIEQQVAGLLYEQVDMANALSQIVETAAGKLELETVALQQFAENAVGALDSSYESLMDAVDAWGEVVRALKEKS